MRILYFSRDYTTHDRRFLAKMVEGGHEVVFVRLRDDGGTYERRDLPAGVREQRWQGLVGPITPDACLERVPAFRELLDVVRPDVVHAGPIPSCAFIAARAGFRPLLSMSWGSDILVEARDDAQVRAATDFALANTELFCVDCDAVRERIQEWTGAPSDRFVQFPWGLELDRFPVRAPRPADTAHIVVLSTRSWEAIYGVDTVVAAFALAHASEPRLRLVLCGDGPLAPEVDRAIRLSSVDAVVRRPGRLPEEALVAEFRGADVYLSCALSDGTSVSLLEAMATGLPVIVTDAPGNREWVAPDRGGWLAAPGDAAAFAAGLLRAARLDDAGRSAVADFNRGVVEQRADWHANTRRLLAAYERMPVNGARK